MSFAYPAPPGRPGPSRRPLNGATWTASWGPSGPVPCGATAIRPSGISSRNREAGLIKGWPHADRMIARDRYNRSRARVMPTYASRRSSASSVGSPSARMCGKTPSSQPVQNTTGNSRPFAVCKVISVTTPSSESGHRVGVGHQRHPFEECRQGGPDSDRRRRPRPLGVCARPRRMLGELPGHRDQFRQVVQPAGGPAGRRWPRTRRGSRSFEHRFEDVGTSAPSATIGATRRAAPRTRRSR